MRSHDLEHQLFSKEKELEHLFQKQKRVRWISSHESWLNAKSSTPPVSLQLELQCHELHSEKQESNVENVKLKVTNDELCRALESTSQELGLAQEQLAMLQEQAARLQQEKEMWVHAANSHTRSHLCVCITSGLSRFREMYRVTEGLQREKQSLQKQLDLLRCDIR